MATDRIVTGDCFEVVADLPANSVHAVVTDPPYGLAFMGRDWDDFEPREYQDWCAEWGEAVRRVLKPGGHLLAFSGNRTHHRLFSGIEDAGYEIRDTLTWHYGSGFPKALDVSKELDKKGGNAELTDAVADALQQARESRGVSKTEADEKYCGGTTNYTWFEGRPAGTRLPPDDTFKQICNDWPELEEYREQVQEANREVVGEKESGIGKAFDGDSWNSGTDTVDITTPATDAAERWDGFKTALKPATEFVVLARAPLSAGTVAENVQTHGTGALNIDGCRVDTGGEELSYDSRKIGDGDKYHEQPEPDDGGEQHTEGRYPANVVFHEDAAAQLDREVGECESGGAGGNWSDSHSLKNDGETMYGGKSEYDDEQSGPSRYFYTSKATRAERTLGGKIDNAHPTVKPADLMEWLVRLVTAEGHTVLDPFAGTGTTCRAAKDLGRSFIGIEKQAKWADVARVRCGLTPADPSHVRADDAQAGLESFGDD